MTNLDQLDATSVTAALVFAAAGANPAKLAQWLADNNADGSDEPAARRACVGGAVTAAA